MMANVGKLTIELAASVAKFQSDLGKATASADAAAKRISASMSLVKGVVGGLVGALSVDAFISSFKGVVAAAEQLGELSEATGSSVEALSRLKNIAEVGGTSFDTFKSALERLSAGMAGAEEGSSKTAAALKFLKVSATDPAKALEEIAKKLDGFADGAGKAALAKDLFGKSGVAFISTLKDIASAGDVAATVTAKQAQEATRLADAFRTLEVQSGQFRNELAASVIPALANAIEQFQEGKRAAGGFLEAIRLFDTINPFKDTAGNIRELRLEIEQLQANKLKKSVFFDAIEGTQGIDKAIADATKKLQFLQFQQRQAALALIDPSNNDARDLKAQQKPQLPYNSVSDKVTKALREHTSEAQRYLEQLQKQLERTQDLTVAETVLTDLRNGRLKLSDGITEDQLLCVARQIDGANALKKFQEQQNKLLEEEARIREAISKQTSRDIDAEYDEVRRLMEGNEAIREQIAIISGGVAAHDAIEKARVSSAIALKEDTLAAYENAGANGLVIDAIKQQIGVLKQRQGLLDKKGLAETLADETRKLQDFNNALSDMFADSLSSVVTGSKSAKDALKDLEGNIISMLTRLATQKIGDAIFGGNTGSGSIDFGAIIGKLLGAFSGAPSTGFGMNVRAMGGPVAANTPYWVGERGPEVVVPRSAGTVIPNHALGRGGSSNVVNISVNVPPSTGTASARQIAVQTGREVQRHMRRA
jgi:hypothetical protein